MFIYTFHTSVRMLSHVHHFAPKDYSPPGFSIHGIFQERILEWVAISCSRGYSQSINQTCVFCTSCFGKGILSHCTTREAYVSRFNCCKLNEWWKYTHTHTHTHTHIYIYTIYIFVYICHILNATNWFLSLT